MESIDKFVLGVLCAVSFSLVSIAAIMNLADVQVVTVQHCDGGPEQ